MAYFIQQENLKRKFIMSNCFGPISEDEVICLAKSQIETDLHYDICAAWEVYENACRALKDWEQAEIESELEKISQL